MPAVRVRVLQGLAPDEFTVMSDLVLVLLGSFAGVLLARGLVRLVDWLRFRQVVRHGGPFTPCRTCGRCCCRRCIDARRLERWHAPPAGGYHGCVPRG